MRLYEGIFVFSPQLAPEVRAREEEQLNELIKRCQGQVVQKTEWGTKSLGYTVKKFREGFFLILDIQMDPAQMAKFRDAVILQETIIKFMLTLKGKQSKNKKKAEAKPETIPGTAS